MELETQKIIDRILADARENAEFILMDARKSAEKKMEEQKKLARMRAESEASSILKKGKDEAEATRRTVVTGARRKASWMVLSEKERLVTSVLNEVETRFRNLHRSEYLSILQRLIVNAGVAIDDERLEVLLREQDSKLPFDLSIIANAIAEKTGKVPELSISSERIESYGGCVIRTGDKRIVIDNTFSAILKRREKTLRHNIAKILFSE
ncbi:MAG: hypothetical protein JSV76_06710 [Candidatus Bathyarchaeota archaeon]|nr:MAG: hypothetical protein JSV76_06710 [Candidatus Bathyarchaeota archaeon]